MRCASRERSCQSSVMLRTCGDAHSWCEFPSQEYVAKGAAGRATAGHAAASSNTQARGVNVERGGATSVHESRCSLGDGLPAVLLRQLPALLRLAQPWHALTLAAASVVEALLVARSEFPLRSLCLLTGSERFDAVQAVVAAILSSTNLRASSLIQPHLPGAARGANCTEREQPGILVPLYLRIILKIVLDVDSSLLRIRTHVRLLRGMFPTECIGSLQDCVRHGMLVRLQLLSDDPAWTLHVHLAKSSASGRCLLGRAARWCESRSIVAQAARWLAASTGCWGTRTGAGCGTLCGWRRGSTSSPPACRPSPTGFQS